jgi:hypothetical protein
MSVLAAVRPDDWNLALFIHLLGAMVLVGALVLALVALLSAWRGGSEEMTRLGYRALLWGVIPSYIVMRAGAEWIADKEGLNEEGVDVDWVNIGYMASDPGLLLIIISTVLAGIGARRAARADGGSAVTLDRVAGVLLSIALLGFLVAIWAMTTKPS